MDWSANLDHWQVAYLPCGFDRGLPVDGLFAEVAVDRIVVDQAPVIPLFHGSLCELIKPWIRFIHLLLDGMFSAKDIIAEQHCTIVNVSLEGISA